MLIERTMANPHFRWTCNVIWLLQTSDRKSFERMLSEAKVITYHERVSRGLGTVGQATCPLKPYIFWGPIGDVRSPRIRCALIYTFPLFIWGNWGKTCGDCHVVVLVVAIRKCPWLLPTECESLEVLSER
jgi:hypothetical protein